MLKASVSAVCTVASVFALQVSSAKAEAIVYTVTTSGANATNLLEEAKVEINDNGVVSVADFSEVEFVGGSVFRKRGEGFLKSCSKMGSFSGEVRIEEGAFIIDNAGQLGPSVEKSESDPLVVVSNGASLVVAAIDSLERNVIRLCGGIRIAGRGYNGIGAVRSESKSRIKSLFSSDLTLDGDATIVNASQATAADDMQWGTKSGLKIYLNTFTLTVSGRRFWSQGVDFKNPGHVVIAEDGYLQFQNNHEWGGSKENTLTVKSGGIMEFYGTLIEAPWTLVLEDGAQLRSSKGNSVGLLGQCIWTGPVVAEGRVLVQNVTANSGFELHGAISGAGGFLLQSGGMELVSPRNSFRGGVSAGASGEKITTLGVWSATALSSAFSATNANLTLSPESSYSLPELSFHVESEKTCSAAGGTSGTAASLTKSGPGVLEFDSPLAVTGGVTLAGGTLRLSPVVSAYSPAPGLVESRFSVPDLETGKLYIKDWYADGTAMNTNRIVSLPELAEQHYQGQEFSWIKKGFEFVRYKGYIWNREDHDVTWTFAVAICPQSTLYVGEDEKAPQTASMVRTTSNWKNDKVPGLHTVTLSPGPHYFDLRMYSQGYEKPGARGEEFDSWPVNYGFVVDFQGRGVANAEYFSIPSNNVLGSLAGGDGSLFTVDARTRGDVAGDDYSRASFSTLRAAPGTVLDLNAPGRTFTVQELSGMADVKNGNLHITKKWTISGSQAASSKPLSCEDKISFGEGWTLVLTDPGQIRGRATIAVAQEGGLALPGRFECADGSSGKWYLELSPDGKKLEVVRSRFSVILR